MIKETNIRIFNKEIKDLEYFTNASINRQTKNVRYRGRDNEILYAPLTEVMQQTPYQASGGYIYEKDVVLYLGEPALVFFDNETRKAAIYNNDKMVFIENIYQDIELLTTVYDNSKEAHYAITNFNKNISRDSVSGSIFALGVYNKTGSVGAYGLRTSDGVSIDERFKFPVKTPSGAELHCISEGLIKLKDKGSKATLVHIKSSNQFLVDMLNKPGIIRTWAKNGWKYKNGSPIKERDDWERVLNVMDSLSTVDIKASLISEEHKQLLMDFLNK